MKKQWRNALIAFLVTLSIGLVFVYNYREHLIIEAVNYGLSAANDPTKNIMLEDFENIDEYSRVCQEIEALYEEELFKAIAEDYWTTPEHVKKSYMNHVIKETSR